MIPALVRTAPGDLLASPVRLVGLAAAWALPLAMALLSGSGRPLAVEAPMLLACLVGADLISGDRRSGLAALVFTRPITRTRYVASRWLGAAAWSSLLGLSQLAAVAALGPAAFGAPPLPARALLAAAVSVVATCASIAALYCLLGSLSGASPAWALHLSLVALAGSAKVLAPRLLAGHERPVDEALRALLPVLDVGAVLDGARPSWFLVASWSSTLVGSLALAAWLANRRQLSYSTLG